MRGFNQALQEYENRMFFPFDYMDEEEYERQQSMKDDIQDRMVDERLLGEK